MLYLILVDITELYIWADMLAMLGLKAYIGDSKKSFSKTVISNVNRTGYLLCSSRKSTEHGYIRMIEVLVFQAMPN